MSTSLLVGLTGGIAAGKSTVARALAAHGARIVDGDDAARAVVDHRSDDGTALLTRIADLLGADVRLADGSLDRAAVATRVFGDDGLRRDYDALMRPALLSEVERRITSARSAPGIVVHEIPLLSRRTVPLPWHYDIVVTVEARSSVRLERLKLDRGHTAEEASRRLRAQGDEADRVAIADVVIRTDGTMDETRAAVAELWVRLNDERQRR